MGRILYLYPITLIMRRLASILFIFASLPVFSQTGEKIDTLYRSGPKATYMLDSTVISFELVYKMGGAMIMESSGSNRFTQNMKSIVENLKPGNIVYIENIRASRNGQAVKLPPKKMVIK